MGLTTPAYDMPWLMIYTCSPAVSASSQHLQLNLHSSVGVPASHPAAPVSISVPTPKPASSNLNSQQSQSSGSSQTATSAAALADASLPWPFAEALTTRRQVLVPDATERSAGMAQRGWDEPTRLAVVVPIGAEDADTPLAVLVLGLNPRLQWSEAYAAFVRVLGRQLATGAQTSLSYEQAHVKAEEALALDRAKTHFVRQRSMLN